MSWYSYWQETPESSWHLCLSSDLPGIIAESSPAFTTVLDLDTSVQRDFTGEDYAAIKYRGAFYVDFDGESLEEVVPQFKKFLSNIEEDGVNLEDCQLSVTGGRGFHVLIPQKVFERRPSTTGHAFLPQIYREMANAMFVDTLDLRVYSAKKGRMWRTFGVQRPNGKYKVQITVEEAREMTVELYNEIASTPREVREFSREPEFSRKMATLFAECRDKVLASVRNRAKRGNEVKALEKYRERSETPTTIEMVMKGEGIKDGVGFQKIATQLAISAHALGMEEADFIEKCQGLCDNHSSDGTRYNTPAKRRAELRRMFQYMDGNPCYEWSAGGVISLVEEGTNVSDLRTSNAPPKEADEELDESDLDPLCEGIVVRQSGMYVRVLNKEIGEWEFKFVSDIGISNVSELLNYDTYQSEGFEVTIHTSNGVHAQRINNNDFETRIALRRALGSHGHIRLTDAQAGGLQTVLSKMAQKGNRQMISIKTEGINILKRLPKHKDPTGKSEYYQWWVDAKQPYFWPSGGEDLPNSFRLDPVVESNSGAGRSDLAEAPLLEDTEETREVFDIFFQAFPKDVTAKVFGWYCAGHMAPLLRHHFAQFPVLQSYGTAGSGKTSFNWICAHLHTYKLKPNLISTPHATPFSLETPLSSSYSIPVLFDEVKFSEMDKRRADAVKTLLRNNFNGNSGAKGRVSRDSGASKLMMVETLNVAPMAVMAEAKIDQEAILHRSVLASFPHTQVGGEETARFMTLKSKASILGCLGKLICDGVMRTNVETFGDRFQGIQQGVLSNVSSRIDERQLYNLSVVVAGLKVAKQSLSRVFGERYNEIMDGLISEIEDKPDTHVHRSMSEISRVIDILASLSARDIEDPLQMKFGEDWNRVHLGSVDIHIRNAWDKYTRLCRSQGTTPLFATEVAFMDAIYRHPAAIDRSCQDNDELKKGRVTTKVVRLSESILAEEGVEEFNLGRT